MAKIKKAQPGVKVVPKNLNERQMKRVDRIEQTNPERAKRVADRISNRRNARGAENPRMSNVRPPDSMPSPDRLFPTYGVGSNITAKKGKTISKAKNGSSLGMKSVKAGFDKNSGVTRADFVSIGKGKAQNGKKLIKSGVKGMSENDKVKKGITKLVPSSSQIKANVMPPKKKMGGSMKKCKYGCK